MANKLKLSRSPIELTHAYIGGASYAILNIEFYRGTSTNKLDTQTFSFRKPVNAGEDASFDVSQLAFDLAENVQQSTVRSDIWASEYTITQYDNTDTSLGSVTGDAMYLNGYREFSNSVAYDLDSEEVAIPMTNKVVYWDERYSLKIPVLLDDTLGRTVLVNGVPQGGFGTSDDTRYILRETVRNTFVSGEEDFTIGISDGTDVIDEVTVKALPKDFCKYDPMAIEFINRFGVLQRIHVGAKQTENLTTKKESYFKNPVAYNGNNQPDNQYQDFNVNGRGSLQVNTGYVSEDYNEVIKELLLSEHVWVISPEGTKPVTPTTSAMTYKTRVNDKLINFTIDLQYSFDEIIVR